MTSTLCEDGENLYEILWVVPLPSNIYHQDYYIFSRGSQPKPSFATVTGRGDNPRNTRSPIIMATSEKWRLKGHEFYWRYIHF